MSRDSLQVLYGRRALGNVSLVVCIRKAAERKFGRKLKRFLPSHSLAASRRVTLRRSDRQPRFKFPKSDRTGQPPIFQPSTPIKPLDHHRYSFLFPTLFSTPQSQSLL